MTQPRRTERPSLTITVTLFLSLAAALAACGRGSSDTAAASRLQATRSTAAQTSAPAASDVPSSAIQVASGSSEAPSLSTASPDLAKVDVCTLLTPADAISVAKTDKFDAAQTASTVYTLTTSTDSLPPSACNFTISDGAAQGAVSFRLEPGSDIYEYVGGTKVPGLGDEAYTSDNAGTVVRVGDYLLTEGFSTFTSQITLDLLRRIAPHLP